MAALAAGEPAARGRRPSPPTGVLIACLAAAALLLLVAGRHLTFFFDEWTFVLTRRGGGLDSFLQPHNGHLALFSVAVYKALLGTVGLRHYLPYRLVGIALHLLCAALLYVLLRRRIDPWAALVPTVLLLFMGSAWEDLLWPFQISYLGSLAGGLGALAVVDRPDGRGRGWAALLLIWSLASSGVGLSFLLAATVVLLLRREPWRRFWIVLAPALLYGLWYLGWASGESTTAEAILGAPQYVLQAAAGAILGVAGLSAAEWGPPLLVAAVAAIGVGLSRRPVPGLRPLLLAAGAGVMLFWTLTAVVRTGADEPAASRYLYVGAVFIFLIAAESLAVPRSPAMISIALVVVAAALAGNMRLLRDGERGLRHVDDSVRASLGAAQIAAPVIAPALEPDPRNAPQIQAGPYLAAVRSLGSPAPSPAALLRAPRDQRARADAVLDEAELASPRGRLGTVSSPPLAVERQTGRLRAVQDCREIAPAGPPATLWLRVPPGAGVLVRASGSSAVSVGLRRFAGTFTSASQGPVAAGARRTIAFPGDGAPGVPWHLQLTARAPFSVCRAGP